MMRRRDPNFAHESSEFDAPRTGRRYLACSARAELLARLAGAMIVPSRADWNTSGKSVDPDCVAPVT
jgi:hypothetical protein